jgi:acetoin utilization deacetylase AcuC-like enzyme
MRVVYSADHHAHDPAIEVESGRAIPQRESPPRAELIRAALVDDGRFTFAPPTEHGLAPIEAVHDPAMVRYLETAWAELQAAGEPGEPVPDTFLHMGVREGMGPPPEPVTAHGRFGYWCFETYTPLVEGTYVAARAAVDVALSAADAVAAGERVAYGLCRPPGHHAPRAAFGGYCFFNNAAVVAARWSAATGTRVAVIDVDYHHGNGTQQIFYERDDVLYASLHGDPARAYPHFAGYAEETGSGRGRGATHNVPLEAGCTDERYVAALDEALDVIDGFGAALVVVSLGVDTFRLDPLSDLAIDAPTFAACGARLAGLGVPTVILQEGGYHLESLGENVRRWLDGFGVAAGVLAPI